MVAFSYILMTLLMLSGLFLIGLILLQRGRGGGLAGAFGGMGGQSAFGTKAGDVFTRITIGVATAWIVLCAGSVVALHQASTGRFKSDEAAVKKTAPVDREDSTKFESVDLPTATKKDQPAVDPNKQDEAEKRDAQKPADETTPEEPDNANKAPEAAAPAKPVDEKAGEVNEGEKKQPEKSEAT